MASGLDEVLGHQGLDGKEHCLAASSRLRAELGGADPVMILVPAEGLADDDEEHLEFHFLEQSHSIVQNVIRDGSRIPLMHGIGVSARWLLIVLDHGFLFSLGNHDEGGIGLVVEGQVLAASIRFFDEAALVPELAEFTVLSGVLFLGKNRVEGHIELRANERPMNK